MGCSNSTTQIVQPIQDPTGQAVDPLEKQGDVVKNIAEDPHINFYQKQIASVLDPIRRKKNKLKSAEDIQVFATTDRKQHQKYIESVNSAIKGNSITTTNILSYMINEIADPRQVNQLNKFQANDAYAALKCFVYLYTGSYTYQKINKTLRKSHFEKISKVIGIVKQQLEKYNEEHFARKLKANAKYGKFIDLYRGIPKPDKLMVKGKRLYWKGFTSTSVERKIASKFGRYHYVIQLDKNAPHDYMIVPPQLSQFDEEEVILFPYFYLECDNVEDFTSGANYFIKQIPPDTQT